MYKYGRSLAVQWLGLSALTLPWAWVQSLVGELRSCKLRSVVKKQTKQNRTSINCY